MIHEGMLLQDRYEVQQAIGNGAMGSVYRGLDHATQTIVAIKVIRDEVSLGDATLVRRFLKESRVLSQLNHPHIVKVLATAPDDAPFPYIIMEYVGGATLAAHIQHNGILPVKPALQVAYAIASAVAYIHTIPIIHRDIKPSNIMFTEKGSPRLMDFGVAFLDSGTALTTPGSVLGTLAYTAPEVIYGQKATESADIWSFGVTLYQMFAGKLPFPSALPAMLIADILSKPIPPLEDIRPDLPPIVLGLIYMMLQKDPIERIDTMARVKATLKEIKD
ncbi:MAG: serine/threonine-protein kinase [Phototrophicaceae bacterium]